VEKIGWSPVQYAMVQAQQVKGLPENDAQNVMERENWDASKGNNWKFWFQLVSHFIVRLNHFGLNALLSSDSVNEKENIR